MLTLFKKQLVGFSVLLLLMALTGCNTVSGLGDDLKAAGGAITESAQKAKDKIGN